MVLLIKVVCSRMADVAPPSGAKDPETPRSAGQSVLMWEVRAAEGRLADLVAYAREHADPSAQIYAASEPDRLVVIDPSGRGLPGVPSDLIARPPHEWTFRAVPR